MWSARRSEFRPSAWIAARIPLVVVEDPSGAVGFAVASHEGVPMAISKCAEAIVYVTPTHRRRGAARAALSELVSVARLMGLWKLVAFALPEDAAARGLLDRLDFRDVGTLVRHAQVEGTWRDVVLHERLMMASRKSMPSIPGV